MVPLSFFYYQWYSRTIERFTTVIILNVFLQKLSKTVNFFSFLFFNSEHKRKLTVLNDFGWKKLKKVTVVRRSTIRLPLIIKKVTGTIDKFQKLRSTIDNFPNIINSYQF